MKKAMYGFALIGACCITSIAAPGCTVGSAGDPSDEAEDVASVSQPLVTEYDLCATGCNANAGMTLNISGSGTEGSYNRTASEIASCPGSAHEHTIVNLSVSGQQFGYIVEAVHGTAQDNDWDQVPDKPSCEASWVKLTVLQPGGVNPNDCGYTELWHLQMPAIWSGGKCIGPTVQSPQGLVGSGSYRANAVAHRFDGKNVGVEVDVHPYQ